MALIYDVGMHRGEDSCFYLFQGHQVIGIDANPCISKITTDRLRPFVEDGRLKILEVAIGSKKGSRDFWIPASNSQWSSLDEAIARREPDAVRVKRVQVTTISEVMQQYGRPYYLKIDIEGADQDCLASLHGSTAPQHISVETECLKKVPDDVLNHAATLERLAALGYRWFKLVHQRSLMVIARDNMYDLAAPPESHRAHRKHLCETFGWRFIYGSSGPWGEELQGDWIQYNAARGLLEDARQKYFSCEQAVPYGFWCDWHAKR